MQRKIITFGLLSASGSVVLSLVQYFGGYLFSVTPLSKVVFGVFPLLLLSGCILLAQYFSQEKGLKALLKAGCGVAIINATLTSLYFLLFIGVIYPEFIELSKAFDLQNITQLQGISPEQLEQMKRSISTTQPLSHYFTTSLIMNFVIGASIAFGGGLLLKIIYLKDE